LHDEIAQTLLGINVRLLTLKKNATGNTKGLKKRDLQHATPCGKFEENPESGRGKLVNSMKRKLPGLSRRYVAALRNYLKQGLRRACNQRADWDIRHDFWAGDAGSGQDSRATR